MVEKNGTVTQINNPDESQEIELLIVNTLVGKHAEYIGTIPSSSAPRQRCS
jgi:hypothetical protein